MSVIRDKTATRGRWMNTKMIINATSDWGHHPNEYSLHQFQVAEQQNVYQCQVWLGTPAVPNTAAACDRWMNVKMLADATCGWGRPPEQIQPLPIVGS